MIPVVEYTSDLEDLRFKLVLFKANNRRRISERYFRKFSRLLEKLKKLMNEYDYYDTILLNEETETNSTLSETVKTLALIMDIVETVDSEEADNLLDYTEELIDKITPYNDLALTD